jgi:hypothetical protein
MIRIDENYTPYREDNDPAYPGGKAVPAPAGNSIAGTPWRAGFFNQIMGFFQAASVEAAGSFEVSGVPDKVGNSDILSAIKVIAARMADEQITPGLILNRLKTVDGAGSGLDADLFAGKPPNYYLNRGIQFSLKQIIGIETIIPLSELNIQYDPEKQYPLLVTAYGVYPEFVSFNADMQPDGVHIRPVRLVDGQLVPGTRIKKWGTEKWGTGSQYVTGKKWGGGKWGDGKWSASRWLGGNTWGGSAPMFINIIIKEF